jgi:hypothetical protein
MVTLRNHEGRYWNDGKLNPKFEKKNTIKQTNKCVLKFIGQNCVHTLFYIISLTYDYGM